MSHLRAELYLCAHIEEKPCQCWLERLIKLTPILFCLTDPAGLFPTLRPPRPWLEVWMDVSAGPGNGFLWKLFATSWAFIQQGNPGKETDKNWSPWARFLDRVSRRGIDCYLLSLLTAQPPWVLRIATLPKLAPPFFLSSQCFPSV